MHGENADRRLLIAGAGLLGLTAAARLVRAGPITPPAGPVSPTGHTLDELFDRLSAALPRIPVGPTATPGDASALYRITQPGSYFLTANVTTANPNQTGIEIAADHVSLDLSGFTLSGQTGGISIGIHMDASRSNVAIRNGTIRSFGYALFGSAQGCHFQDIAIDSCLAGNFETADTHNSIFRNLRVLGAGSGEVGIQAGYNCLIENCSVSATSVGIQALPGSIVSRCCVQNCGRGIAAASATIADCSVTDSTDASSFDSAAISVQNGLVTRCSVVSAAKTGILAAGFATALENSCASCAAGIACVNFAGGRNRIEANTLLNNQRGVWLQIAPNVCVANRFSNNSVAHIDSAAGNTLGELLNFSAGGTLTAANSHPLANIIF